MTKRDDERDRTRPLLTVRPRWGGALLVCGKCLKRHEDGRALRRALKTAAKEKVALSGGRRKPRIVKTACLGLCPKRALVVASAATLATGDVILLRNGGEVAEAVERLLPSSLPPTRASR